MSNLILKDGEITQISHGYIWYAYKGDEITWNGQFYLSYHAGANFSTLEEMDAFWKKCYEILLKERNSCKI